MGFDQTGGGGVSLPVSIANGGTGATSASAALAALGATPTLGAIYGGGAHGAFDLDGTNTYAAFFTKSGSTYTQIADVRSTTFRVRVGATLLPSQFWIYAETSFLNEGTVRLNGNNASGGSGGATISVAGTVYTGSQPGATGRTATNTGALGNATTYTIGGAAGAGGSGGGANVGGGSGGVGAIAATFQGLGTPIFRASHRLLSSISFVAPGGGCGGGSGGVTLGTGTATSGGGGGGASAIRINARSFENTGTITCTGGAGGNAAVTGNAVAGGGGGGGGGFIGVMADTVVTLGTVTCAGGAGGTGAGTGATAGAAGSAGAVSLMTPTGTTNS